MVVRSLMFPQMCLETFKKHEDHPKQVFSAKDACQQSQLLEAGCSAAHPHGRRSGWMRGWGSERVDERVRNVSMVALLSDRSFRTEVFHASPT